MKLNEEILIFLFLAERIRKDGLSYGNFYNFFPERNRGAIKSSLVALLKRKKIEKLSGDLVKFKLSRRGKEEAENFFKKKEETDKFWRILIFDIPEEKRKWRDNLREKLKEMGFLKIQSSLYFSPFKNSESIFEFIENFKLKDFVCLLKIRKDDNDNFKKSLPTLPL